MIILRAVYQDRNIKGYELLFKMGELRRTYHVHWTGHQRPLIHGLFDEKELERKAVLFYSKEYDKDTITRLATVLESGNSSALYQEVKTLRITATNK